MHARNAVRSIEKTLTLADSPYTVLPYIYNVIKVDTTGGNVRVNLPDTNYPIDVIKTSSDAYIVTVWVAGVQIGEVAGELSKITIENAEVTKDEPWFPYDVIVGIAGDEVLAKNRYGKVIAGGRGVAGTDDGSVLQTANDYIVSGGVIAVRGGTYTLSSTLLQSSYTSIIAAAHYNPYGLDASIVRFVPAASFTGTALVEMSPRSSLEGMEIKGNGTSGINGVSVTDFACLKNVFVRSCKYGILATDVGVLNVFSSIFGNNQYGVFSAYGLVDSLFDSCYMYSSAASGFYAGTGSMKNTIIRTTFEWSTEYGAYAYQSGIGAFIGCTFDRNSKNGLYIREGLKSLITGCYFRRNCASSGNAHVKLLDVTNISFGNNLYIASAINDDGSGAIKPDYVYEISGSCSDIMYNEKVPNQVIGVHFSEGYRTWNSGSSTGTGSEQAIPHGLAFIPTRQQVILIAGSATANPFHSSAPDATNIYVTAGNGQDWYWNVP